MSQRRGLLLVIALLIITNIMSAYIAGVVAQTTTVDLHDGEEMLVRCVCATATPEPGTTNTPTPELPTNTPEPLTATPTPLEPTVTPQPSSVIYGIARSPQSDWRLMSNELGVGRVEFLVRPSTSNATILAGLDQAEALGLRVLLHVYDRVQNTNAPWYLDGTTWRITPRGIEILALVEDHPAIWAIYQLHEPFDSGGYHADADSQRALYTFLRTGTEEHGPYTLLPLYTDMGSLNRPHAAGETMGDGMCDICGTFPTTFRGEWTSEQCLAETFSRIDADRAVQAAHMPNSELVFLINTYTLGDGARYRMLTAGELRAVRDYMCAGGNSHLYYPWTGYDLSLDDVPELWPIIAEGCR